LISTIFENLKILPKVGSDLLEEMAFRLLRLIKRNFTYSWLINNVSIPRYFLRRDLKQLLIREGIMNPMRDDSKEMRERWSATTL